MLNSLEDRLNDRKAEITKLKDDCVPDPGSHPRFLCHDSHMPIGKAHRVHWKARSDVEEARAALDKYKGSRMRRTAYMAAGQTRRLQENVKVLETRHQKAVDAEQDAMTKLATSQSRIEMARNDLAQYETWMSQRQDVIQKLEAIYDDVFEGASDRSKTDIDAKEKLEDCRLAFAEAEAYSILTGSLTQHLERARDLLEPAKLRLEKLLALSKLELAPPEPEGAASIEEKDMLDILRTSQKVDHEFEAAQSLDPELQGATIDMSAGSITRGTMFRQLQSNEQYREEMEIVHTRMCDLLVALSSRHDAAHAAWEAAKARAALKEAMVTSRRDDLRKLRGDTVYALIGIRL